MTDLLLDPRTWESLATLTVLEIVEAIQKLMKRTHLKPDIQNTARGEIASQYLNTDKAQRILQWEPQYTLTEGLRETIAWYRKYFAGSRLGLAERPSITSAANRSEVSVSGAARSADCAIVAIA